MTGQHSGSFAWRPVDSARFLRSRIAPRLGEDGVHVWAVRLEHGRDRVSRAWSVLDRGERQRADRFRYEGPCTTFILAHGFLRELLAAYLDRDAGAIAFEVDAYGKPYVGDRSLEFNLSHSGAHALVAVSAGHPVGVDVEEIRPLQDLDALAARFFATPERARLADMAPGERLDAFFACWTRKEAFVKAVGRGLTIALESFDTTLEHGASHRLVRRRCDGAERECCWLSELPALSHHAAAVAVGAPASRSLCCWWMA